MVEIDPDNYHNNFLNMYSHSINVIFNNGFGYEEEDASQSYVKCNELNHFIKYNSSNNSNSNNDNTLKQSIETNIYKIPMMM